MVKIQIIIGSTRPNRKSDTIAAWAYAIAKTRTDATFELVDIADYNLPLLDEPLPPKIAKEYTKTHTKKWAEKIAEADGYIFVTAEYNRSIPGALKNAIDFLNKEWADKAVGFVGYGAWGGTHAVDHLRAVAGELQMADVREMVTLSLYHDFKDRTTFVPSSNQEQQLHKVLDQTIRWATALKTIRV